MLEDADRRCVPGWLTAAYLGGRYGDKRVLLDRNSERQTTATLREFIAAAEAVAGEGDGAGEAEDIGSRYL